MQVPGISLQTLPKVQLKKDFTNFPPDRPFRLVFFLQPSDFKLENANLVSIELTDTGMPSGL
jgi:hypothetical protein